jgi:hypothetical protein
VGIKGDREVELQVGSRAGIVELLGLVVEVIMEGEVGLVGLWQALVIISRIWH